MLYKMSLTLVDIKFRRWSGKVESRARKTQEIEKIEEGRTQEWRKWWRNRISLGTAILIWSWLNQLSLNDYIITVYFE